MFPIRANKATWQKALLREFETHKEGTANLEEPRRNDYGVLHGYSLKELKLSCPDAFGTAMDFGTKTPRIGAFSFFPGAPPPWLRL